jgi:hypothetical protein
LRKKELFLHEKLKNLEKRETSEIGNESPRCREVFAKRRTQPSATDTFSRNNDAERSFLAGKRDLRA